MKKKKMSKLLAAITAVAVGVTMTPFIAFAGVEGTPEEQITDEVLVTEAEEQTTDEVAEEVQGEFTAQTEATVKNEFSYKIAANKKTAVKLSEGILRGEKSIKIDDNLTVKGIYIEDLLIGEPQMEGQIFDQLFVSLIGHDTKIEDESITIPGKNDPQFKLCEVQKKYVVARGTVDGSGTVTNNEAIYIAKNKSDQLETYSTCFAIYEVGEGKILDAADQIKFFYDFGGDPFTLKLSGTGVKAEKTVSFDELKSLAKAYGLAKTRNYYAINSEKSKTLFAEEGIYFEDLFKIKELGIKKGVNDEFEYRLLDAFGTMNISDYTSEDMYGNKPMLVWTETIKFGSNLKEEEKELVDVPQDLEQLKLVIGQKNANDENQPKWAKFITGFVFTGGLDVPEVGTALSTANGAYVVTAEQQTVSLQKPINKKKVTVPATVSIGGITYKVTGISASAFKGSKKVKTLIVKTKDLTKASVKGSLKGSKVKTVKVKVGKKKENKKYVKKYKKIFKKSNSGKKVKVKR